eukprot:3072255-Prorocentrum_lima.AAC.1
MCIRDRRSSREYGDATLKVRLSVNAMMLRTFLLTTSCRVQSLQLSLGRARGATLALSLWRRVRHMSPLSRALLRWRNA